MEDNAARRADIRKDCEEYPPEQYGEMLVDCSGECDLDWVFVLLELGADLDSQSSDGTTAIGAACCNPESESIPIVEFLIGRGCQVNLSDEDGTSPLRWATHYDAPAVCRLLLDAGADVNHQDAKQRSVLLNTVMTAEYTPKTANLVPLLLASGADPNAADSRNETPLRLACKLGLTETITQLLDGGAAVEGAAAQTPLMRAALSTRPEIVELLISRGADVAGKADDRASALMLAICGNDDREEEIEPIVRQLLSAGADVNAVRRNGHSALWSAAKYKRLEVLRLLLEHGADATIVDESGVSLVDFARASSTPQIAVTLKKAAAGAS